MEKTSRDSIAHKIRTTHPTNVPDIPSMSDKVAKKIVEYFNSNKPKNKLSRIRKIYELADEIIAEISVDSVCRKGCAWCCAIPVEITPLEIKYIEANTILKRSNPLKDYHTLAGQEYNVGYCPLLDQNNGTCSVYEYRPFNCRTFLAYDSPDYCRRGYKGEEMKHWVSGGPANGYGNKGLLYLALDLVEADIGEKISMEVKPKVEARVKDIRAYF